MSVGKKGRTRKGKENAREEEWEVEDRCRVVARSVGVMAQSSIRWIS